MRIAIDARSYGTRHFTGIGRYIAELIAALERLDAVNEYTIVLCDLNESEYHPANPRFQPVTIDARPYTFREQVVVPTALRHLDVDLVHFPANFGPVAYRGRRVTTIHDLSMILHPPRSHPGIRGRLDRLRAGPARIAMRRGVHASDAIITISQTTSSELRRTYPAVASRIHVAYEGVSTTELPRQVAGTVPLAPQPFLLFVGLCYPHKNLARLLEAMVGLRRVRPELRLVIAGREDHAYAETRQLASQLGLDGAALFPGRVDDVQLAWLYRHAEAFVFPSLSEGFGLPGLEAMAHGTPVLAARASCFPEIYADAAAYIDPHDACEMASDLERILSDAQELDRLRRVGPQRAETFRWEDTARATMEVYERVGPAR